jgi:hypothetical protein
MSTRYINIDSRENGRLQITRIIAATLLLIWICRLNQGIGLSQLMQPIFSDTKADRFYWLLDSVGILKPLTNFLPLSFGIDILLFVLPILMIAYPSNRFYALFYLPVLVLYFSAYNTSATQQEHTLIGAIAMAFLICFKDNLRFSTVFSAIRFYTCFLMTSAFFWKLSRGALWHEGQMTNILNIQQSAILTETDSDIYSSWIAYLVDHPMFANYLWFGAAAIELSFIIGFFSKRFDSLLFMLFWLFIFADFFVMGLHFWELGILSLLFLRRYSQLFD